MATYPEIMNSQPQVYQNTTLATLMSSAQTAGMTYGLYQSVSNLGGSLGGMPQQTQAGQATNLVGRGQQILTALNQTQMIMNAGSQTLVAARQRLVAITTAARAQRYVVLPTGQVILSGWQIAEMKENPSSAPRILNGLREFNTQIQTVVFQTTMADVQVGLTLAKTAVDILGSFMTKNQAAPTAVTAPTASQLPPATAATAPAIPAHFNPGDPPSGLASGTALTVGGSGPGPGLGIGPGLGAALNASGAATPAGHLAGTGSGGAPGAVLAGGAARGGAPGAGVLGVGGGYGAGAGGVDPEERETHGWLLREDDDLYGPDGTPDTDDGVLS
jgi:hypothetical protein